MGRQMYVYKNCLGEEAFFAGKINLLSDQYSKELIDLESYLNKIPSYMFLPSFRGIPKPEVFLNKFKSKDGKLIYWCHTGLIGTIQEWCKENKINIYGIDDKLTKRDLDMSLDEFKHYVNSWGLSITPRDYQYEAAYKILQNRQSLSQLATRAGKTLIAYIVYRYMLENGAHNILMIVPNTTLVKQGVKDMEEYQEFFKSETVWSKGEMCESSNLTIGTFQSLIKKLDRTSKHYNPKFFDKFDVICCDECHTVKCKSIKTLLEQNFTKFAKLRFGFSGTIPDGNTIESFSCQSLLGPIIQIIKSDELVNEGFLAKVNITQCYIDYPLTDSLVSSYIENGEYLVGNTVKDKSGKEQLLPKDQQSFTKKYVKKLPFTAEEYKKSASNEDYMSYLIDCCKANGSNLLMLEQMILHTSQKRIDVMCDIVKDISKNIIVFAHHTEYLNALEKAFKDKFPNKKVFLINGKTSQKKRDEILKTLNEYDDCILCASYACCGTGLTFKNLYYGIFAQSFKSKTINLQSIGRGMLKSADKDTFYLYDIVDCLPSGRLKHHGKEKLKLYKNENYIINTLHIK